MKYLVITFESTHKAIQAEKTLEAYDIEVIPTPRQLTANCGISLKASVEDFDSIKETMGDTYGDMNQCYEVTQEGQEFYFKKL